MARKLEVTIVGDASSLSKAFGKASKSSSSFGSSMMKVGKLAALGLGAIGVGAAVAGKKMIDMASDAAEVQSKMEVVFGKALPGLTKEIDKFSAATGTSRFAMREQAADLGALLAPLVGTKEKAADMSVQFTKLATDLGSFNNVPTADALLAIRSGLVGEAEPLRRFGVLLNAAAVDAEGLRMGLIKKGQTLTEQEKVQARANLIMQQTSLAQGDATRTAGSMANQMKALRTNVSDAATEIGMALLPTALRVVQAFNDNWPKIKEVAGTVFTAIGTAITNLAAVFEKQWPRIKEAAQIVMDWFREHLQPTIVSVARNITLAWQKAMGKMQDDTDSNMSQTGSALSHYLRGFAALINTVLALIRGDWSEAWKQLKTMVVETFRAMRGVLEGFRTTALAAARAIGQAILNGLKAGMEGIVVWVRGRLDAARTAVVNAATSAYGNALGVGKAIVNGILSGISGLPGQLGGKLKGYIDDAVGFAGRLLKGSGDFMFTKHAVGEPLAQGIVDGFVQGFGGGGPKMLEQIKRLIAKAQAIVAAARSKMQASFSVFSDKLLRAFDAETGAHQTKAGGKLAGIEARRQAEDMASAVTEAQRALEEAQSGGDVDAIAAAQRALFRAQEDIQIVSLQAQHATQQQAYDDQRDAQREALEARLANLGAHFTAAGATTKEGLAAIDKIMRAFGITFAESGQFIGKHFVTGLQAAIGGVAAGAANVAGAKAGGSTHHAVPIVTQVFLDGVVVAENTQKHLLRQQGRNGTLGFA